MNNTPQIKAWMEIRCIHSTVGSEVYTKSVRQKEWRHWGTYFHEETWGPMEIEAWMVKKSTQNGFPIKGKFVELV